MKDYKKIFLWEETVVKIPHKKIKSINKIQKLKNFPVPFLQGWKKKKKINLGEILTLVLSRKRQK